MPKKIKSFGSTNKVVTTHNTNFSIGIDGLDDYGETKNSGFWMGIDNPPCGYTIYVHRNIGGPTIHVAHDDTQCIFFLRSFGSTGTTISEVLAWSTGRTDLWVDGTGCGGATPTPTSSSTNSG